MNPIKNLKRVEMKDINVLPFIKVDEGTDGMSNLLLFCVFS